MSSVMWLARDGERKFAATGKPQIYRIANIIRQKGLSDILGL